MAETLKQETNRILRRLLVAIEGIGGGSDNATASNQEAQILLETAIRDALTVSIKENVTYTTLTGVGATLDNIKGYSIINIGDSSGLIDGVVIPEGLTINIKPSNQNNTLSSVSLDATGTTFLLIQLI